MKFENKISKINRGNLIVTLLNILNVKETNKTSLLNFNDTNGGELLLTANSPKY